MIPTNAHARWLIAVVSTLLLASCGDSADDNQGQQEPPQQPSNRIDVPEQVRRNLGIEFVAVERRRVAATLRLPARVELLPAATHEYRAPLTGRVTLKVMPLQTVEPGDVLYVLNSAEWRTLQRELGERSSQLEVSRARLAAMPPLLVAGALHESSLREAHVVTTTYLGELEVAQQNIGGQSQRIADTRVALAQLSAQIAEASEKHTETQTRITELQALERAQGEQLQLALGGAAATLGMDPAQLTAVNDGRQLWRTLAVIEVRATAAGVVDQIETANGSLVEAHGPVIVTIDPARVRCRARALQSDLDVLRDDLSAAIVPAGGGSHTIKLSGSVQLAPRGDSRARTLDVFVTPTGRAAFLRPGIVVFVEIETSSSAAKELAIPKSCVLPDGLDRVFFRRDPNDPDKVIRVVADMGLDDGRWVAIRSGLMDGDHVVAAGAFELVLASSDTTMKGGHFHADGTWHADGEDHK